MLLPAMTMTMKTTATTTTTTKTTTTRLIVVVVALAVAQVTTTAAALLESDRVSAATVTAAQNPSCAALGSFYWEIGDGSSALAGASTGDATVTSSTRMLIASASKWIYGAYVAQLRGSTQALTQDDLAYLRMQSGYVSLSYTVCALLKTGTVQECANSIGARARTLGEVGKFHYNGGHMQHHASDILQLGPDHDAELAAKINRLLGTDHGISYDSPQLAAGVTTTPAQYAAFLQKIVSGQLATARQALATNPVCTNPSTCPTAIYAPIPSAESWHYSLAHWIEDDPTVGDGSFSSPGAFGFYPWIDASATYYGILARYKLRNDGDGSSGDPVAIDSVSCGRLIRQAWFTGKPVLTDTVPTPSLYINNNATSQGSNLPSVSGSTGNGSPSTTLTPTTSFRPAKSWGWGTSASLHNACLLVAVIFWIHPFLSLFLYCVIS